MIKIVLNESNGTKSGYAKQLNMAKGYSLTKAQRYDSDMMAAQASGTVKSTLGLTILGLIPYFGFIPAAVAVVRTCLNREKLNSDRFARIKELVENDSVCQQILQKIEKEIIKNKPDKATLKSLRAQFMARVKAVQEDVANECVRFEIDCMDQDTTLSEMVNFLAENDFEISNNNISVLTEAIINNISE